MVGAQRPLVVDVEPEHLVDRGPCGVGPPVVDDDVGAVLAEPARGGGELQATTGQQAWPQEDLDVARLEGNATCTPGWVLPGRVRTE